MLIVAIIPTFFLLCKINSLFFIIITVIEEEVFRYIQIQIFFYTTRLFFIVFLFKLFQIFTITVNDITSYCKYNKSILQKYGI